MQFNVSHTSSLIACGVVLNKPIGIDVEEKQRILKNSISSFAKRYLSQREVEFLLTFSDPEIQRQEFIKLWTLKEAYVKALGRGFSAAPFRTFTIQFRSNEGLQIPLVENADASEIVVASSDDPINLTNNWQFALLELASAHYAAICVKKDDDVKDKRCHSLRLKVWKTLPLVKDECISGTDEVVPISGLS